MDLNNVEELIPAERAAIDAWRPGDAWLGGGTWLFSEPQPGLRRLIDLSAFRWPALTASERGLEIAATCPLAELARWPGPGSPPAPQWPAISLLRLCCDALLGSFKVWNAATVGGNLCMALPAGPMTSLAASLDAVCTVWQPGGRARTVNATEFVLGPERTVLAPGELLRSILLPDASLRCATSFRQYSLAPLGRSGVVVIGRRAPGRSLARDGDRADERGGEVVITVTASVPRPVQLRFTSLPTSTQLSQAFDAAGLEYYDDPHGDPEWREHLSRRFAEAVRSDLAGMS